MREQFASQFAYAERLFHEVQESDPVREKYPLLFLTARAPGHGELPQKIFLDLVEANRRQLLALGVPANQHCAIAALYFLPNRSVVLLPRREGSDRKADGGRGNQGLAQRAGAGPGKTAPTQIAVRRPN